MLPSNLYRVSLRGRKTGLKSAFFNFRVLDEMFENGEVNIENKNEAILLSLGRGAEKYKIEILNKKELSLIENINKKWKNKRTSEIVDFTHSQLPWRIGRDGETVHYELITQEDPDHVY